MKLLRRSALDWLVLVVFGVLNGWFVASPPAAEAQNAGNDAVYDLSGNIVASTSFIDASVFIGTGTHKSPNICGVIYGILSSNFYTYPAAGAVVDARGISGTTALTCATGKTPWTDGTTPVSVPSTILLPATGGSTPTPIVISTPWVIPSNTHLIGEGDGLGSDAGTTIQVASGFVATPGYFLQMGSASGDSGISIERLTIDGKGLAINGISNQYAGRNSYVDHVSLYQIRGTGLLVEGTADGSGPYSNLTFDTGAYSGLTSTVCAQILTVASVSTGTTGGTQGFRGLSCHSESFDAQAALLLDSSNNSIEDVTITGFYDGILVGSQGAAQSNVLTNIIGDTSRPVNSTPVNAIHISGNYPVTALAIIGVSNSSLAGTFTIQDDLTSTHLSDSYVGIYVLGEPQGNGYSRFTTSTNAATWVSGSSAPSGSCTAFGSLFSNTGGAGTGAALSVCKTSGSWAAVSNK